MSVITTRDGGARRGPRPSKRGQERLRGLDAVGVLGGVAVLGTVLYSASRSGGYFPATFTAVAAVGFVVLAVQLVIARSLPVLALPAWAALGGLTGLVLWTGLSASWSEVPGAAALDLERTAGYVAAFAIGLLLASRPRQTRPLVGAVLAALGLIVLVAAASRLLPGIVDGDPATDSIGMYRLGYPLGYWNSVGAVSAMCAVLALGHAASRRSGAAVRALSAALSVLAVATLAMTLSRASWVSFAIGVAILVGSSVQRTRLFATLLVVLGAAAPVVVAILATDALVVDPAAGSGQRSAGQSVALLLAVAGVAAAVGTTLIEQTSRALGRVPQRTLTRFGLAAAAAVGVLAVTGYVVVGDRVEGETVTAVERVENFFERQWDEFNDAAGVPVAGPERLTTAGGTRSRVYSIALDGFADAPLIGEGAGAFAVRWARERDVGEDLRDAHSLPLETLAELGLIGMVFLVVFVGSVGVGVRQRRRDPGRSLPRAVNAAVAGALGVWVVHASVDWDWEMPAVTLPAMFLAATVFPRPRGANGRRPASA